jgi:hypothetical protein
MTARHDTGMHAKIRIPVFPSNGRITIRETRDRATGQWLARLLASSSPEIAQLKLTEKPVQPGNVGINLGGTLTNVPVISTKQVHSLSINADG